MNIVVLHKMPDDTLACERAFYGDVEHCVKQVRKQYPKAFVNPDWWIHDNRWADKLPAEIRQVIGEDQEWAIVWGGPFHTGVAVLVRKA